jgi:hypothetical protein
MGAGSDFASRIFPGSRLVSCVGLPAGGVGVERFKKNWVVKNMARRAKITMV